MQFLQLIGEISISMQALHDSLYKLGRCVGASKIWGSDFALANNLHQGIGNFGSVKLKTQVAKHPSGTEKH